MQAKLFEGMPFQFNVEVERTVSASGICRSVFICLRACACASFCVCVKCLPQRPYHLLTHLLPSKTEPPPPLLMSPHQSQIQPQLSLPFSMHVFPSPCRAGLARVQQPPLPLYHCVVLVVRPCWYHTIPGREIHAAWPMYRQVL